MKRIFVIVFLCCSEWLSVLLCSAVNQNEAENAEEFFTKAS